MKNTAQIELLKTSHSLKMLPSAKVRSSDKKGVHGWTSFYAAYSHNFVSSVFDAIGVKDSDMVLDPFVGSGTTAVVANERRVSATFVDIDPFACVLTRAKIANLVDENLVNKLLSSKNTSNHSIKFSDEALEMFDSECLGYAENVYRNLIDASNCKKEDFFAFLLGNSSVVLDSIAVALAGICISASLAAKLIRGSNPTWYRKLQSGEVAYTQPISSVVKHTCRRMISDLKERRVDKPSRNFKGISILNEDFLDLKADSINDRKFDYVVTSPPYATRLDYAVKHRPNIQMLSGIIDVDVDKLRKKMIGTAKIISKEGFRESWGNTCIDVCQKIENHESYASSSYYIWTYLQYFNSLQKTLSIMVEKCNIGAEGILVLQDSYYKEVEIPLSFIAVEMLRKLNVGAETVSKEEIKVNMRSINPNHRKSMAKGRVNESVVYFKV